MKRQSGFTLVEIAIVLVVIGLLLGGVLKGQELVLNAKIRNAINEYNNVASAMFAYQDRYRKLPGDDDTAFTRWGVVNAAVVPGNGNGVIEGQNYYADSTSSAPLAAESGLFWMHLRNDRLIVGDVTLDELPRNAFDGSTGVEDSPLLFNVLASCQSNIPEKPAIIIDTRIDDGNGDLGTLQGIADAAAGTAIGATPVSYTATVGGRYTLCREI